ncbi:hypothetical protein ADIMK_0211 [Marinobacterium lacunae]|uniref:Uncharacterized protein n=2 Tax=Marinobacterium lacunae TaxID=1232683 RepID=A0A081G480_9GAMM|nr:hypothetical protein ADIMK_0211 [Marinobacterium lacunae]
MRGGAKVWIVEGAFALSGKVIAEGKCALQTAKKNEGAKNEKEIVELVMYHNGIKAEVEITVSGSVGMDKSNSGNGNDGINGYKKSANNEEKKGVKREWIWAEPLNKKVSPFRINVFGD